MNQIAKVEDIAEYILSKTGNITAMKLEKLVYYSQAWSLVFDDEPLFAEKIEAWANGPVVRELYKRHAGSYLVTSVGGNLSTLKESAKKRIDSVLKVYADKTAQWLSDLTHSERPWQSARKNIPEGENSQNEITLESMKNFYTELLQQSREQKA